MGLFELTPSQIQRGWSIIYNEFSMSTDDINEDELLEDLLQLQNKNIMIDVGWYPEGDINGSYKIYLTDKELENPFDSPLKYLSTSSVKEVLETIEFWTNDDCYLKCGCAR